MRTLVSVLLLAALLPVTSVADEQEARYTFGIIGTGNMGAALGKQFSAKGHTVIYGSRDPSRKSVAELVLATGNNASATTQAKAAEQADIVVLAVPWSAIEFLIPKLGDLDGKIVIDITTAFDQGDDGYPVMTVETSTSEVIQSLAPQARIVKTPFGGAETVRNPARYGEPPMTYIAADDREAKETVAQLVHEIGFFPLDAGPLRMARSIDHLGLLYLANMMQGRDHTWSLLPRVDLDLSCLSTEGWFAPVADKDDIASFPNLESYERQCP